MTEEKRALYARKEDGEEVRKIAGNVKLSKSENAWYTMHSMQLMQLKPIDVRLCEAKTLEERCYKYFEMCIEDQMKPSFAGFALALNTARTTLLNYINGVVTIPSDNLEVLRRFNGVLNALMEDYMQNGKINPVAGIFLLKNNANYKDQQEFVVNNQIEEKVTPESLLEEAQLLLDKKE